MADDSFRLAGDFEPVTYAQWRRRVEDGLPPGGFEKRLRTRTLDGIVKEPLYSADDPFERVQRGAEGLPGLAPFTRGAAPLGQTKSGWQIRVVVDDPEPGAALERAREALGRGADSLWLRFARPILDGGDGDAAAEWLGDGLTNCTLAEMRILLADVDLARTPLMLSAGSATLPAAGCVLLAAHDQRVNWRSLRGSWGDDPLGQLATTGRVAEGLERRYAAMADLTAWTAKHAPGVRTVDVSTLPYAEAGASAAEEIACALGTFACYLRALTASGIELDTAACQIGATLALGRDMFMELAKFRALRTCWSRLVEACGGSNEAQRVALHGASIVRRRTVRDPWVNLLRATVETFVGATGGADALTIRPLDVAVGSSDRFGERLARNTQIVLREESLLHRVADPGGGSWYVERLTRQLARAGWETFLEIEREGGMAAALVDGRVGRRITDAAARAEEQVARRRRPVTGVSTWANLDEERIVREAPDPAALRAAASARLEEHRGEHDPQHALAPLAAILGRDGTSSAVVPTGEVTEHVVEALARGASFGAVAEVLRRGGEPHVAEPIAPRREAEIFESLRDLVEAAPIRPRVFLANLGPIHQHRARAMFAANFFAAGGVEPVPNDGFADPEALAAAYRESGAELAVICSSDAVYEEWAEQAARALKGAGARLILLAGRPGSREEELSAAGVDRFIFLGANVHEILTEALEAIEVIR